MPSIAATSLGVTGRMEGQAKAFSKHTECFSSPSARGTREFPRSPQATEEVQTQRMFPPRDLVHLDLLGRDDARLRAVEEDADNTTLTDCRAPALGAARASRDAARTTTRVGNAGQFDSGLAAIGWSLQPRHPRPARCLRPRVPRQHLSHDRASYLCLTPISVTRTATS